jgi:hypothetical protein
MYALGCPWRRENCVLPDEVLDIVSDFVKRGREGNELREEEVPARRLPRRIMLVSSEEDECAFSRADRRLVRAWGSMVLVGVVIGKVGMTRQDLM